MAGMLSRGDAMVIGIVLKVVLDLVSKQTGRKVTIEDLPAIIADEEVRRVILEAQRNATIEAL